MGRGERDRHEGRRETLRDTDAEAATEPAPERDLGADAAGSTLRDGPGTRPIAWRRNLYAILIAQTLAIIAFNLRAPFLPFFLADLGVTSTERQAVWSGIVAAGGAGVMAVTAPIWGAVADRYGRKPMVLRSMFASTATIGLMAVVTDPWQLLALRLVEGALAGTVTASTALVAASTPKERIGFSLGMVQTAVFSGSSVGPLIGGLLADRLGFRPTFVVAGLTMAIAGVIVLFLVRERFVPAPRGPKRGARAALRSTAGLILGPAMLTMIVVMLVVRLAASATQPILPLYVEQLAAQAADAASSLAGLTLGVLGLTSAVSAVYLGRLGDRVGQRPILLASALGAGLLYLPMAAVTAPWQLIALQGLFGVAAGGLIPTANALVAGITPAERRGLVYGMTAAAASLGGFFGPLAGGAVAASLGFPATFLATGVLLLLLTAGVAVSFAAQRRAGNVPARAAG